MRRASRAGALCLAVGGATLIVWFVACTGEDAVLTRDDGAAPSESGTPDGNVTDASSPPDGGSPSDAQADVHPVDAAACPPLARAVACGPALDASIYGRPALHLDACAMGAAVPQHVASTWTAQTGEVLQPLAVGANAGGATFCRAALNDRPGMVFENGGFTIPVGSTAGLDDAGPSTKFIIVAVMKYSENLTSGGAGGIVFQRNSSAAPFFPGPQLIATFAYASAPGTTNLDSTDLLGASVRFGTKDPTNAGDAGSLSIVTATPRLDEVLVAYARSGGNVLTFRVNDETPATLQLPGGGLETGQGLAVNIGATGSANNCLRGAIGELLYYVGDNEPNEVDLIAGLKAKWNIPPR